MIGRNILLQVLFEERLHLVVGNHAGDVVVKVHVGGAGDDHEFLVGAGQQAEGVLAEIAAVGLLAVDEEDGILDLAGPGQQGLVQEALAADDVPPVVGVAAALVGGYTAL